MCNCNTYILMCKLPKLTYQQLSDSRTDLRAEFQHARRMSDKNAMRSAFKDICLIDEMLREGRCIVFEELDCN